METRQYILKNMISKSCVKLIELKFAQFEGVLLKQVRMGEVKLEFDPKKISEPQLIAEFRELGFEPLLNHDQVIAEKIKLAAIELIHYASNNNSLIRNSDYISDKVQLPYDKISKIFSKVCGQTLEKYIILLKIEKAKELIMQNELTLSEISYKLGYSSVQYLSNQFKKVTGITVSDFKESPEKYRVAIEELLI